MIEITPDMHKVYPQAFALARRDKIRVVWLADDLAYAARQTPGHGRYLVRLFLVDGKLKLQCNSVTGELCKNAEFRAGLCAHAAAVINRRWSRRRTQRKEAA